MTYRPAPDALAAAVAERHAALRELLLASDLDAFLATSTSGVLYLSGFRSQSSFQGFAAVLVQSAAPPVLLYPALDSEAVASVPDFFATHEWSDEGGAVEALVDLATAQGLNAGRIRLGVEERHITLLYTQALSALLNDGAIASAGARLDGLRLRKGTLEIDAAREAGDLLSAVCERAFSLTYEGRSELELQLEIDNELKLAGAEASSVLVLGGPNSSIPRTRPGSRTFEANDVVLVDIAASFGRIWSDITRCGCVGQSHERADEAWEILTAAHAAGVSAARVGATVGDIDRAARHVIESAGFGAFFVHRTGHGIGLDVIEAPAVAGDNSARLDTGMMFTVEPGVYLPGEFGFRLEDCVVLSDRGPYVLTSTPRALRILS